jgi:arylsulfatase A-like enzyme
MQSRHLAEPDGRAGLRRGKLKGRMAGGTDRRGSAAALPVAGIATFVLLALAVGSCDHAPERARPNVVLISIDMLRPDHLGCYGHARATSPAIDRLASEGVLFENHVSSSSWTLPAHAALFTSLPDSLHGCTDDDQSLAPGQVTLAERFRAAGYATAGFFSGPYLHPAFGLGQGFDLYEDCTSYAKAQRTREELGAGGDLEVMHASHKDITSPNVFAAFERWFGAREPAKPFFLFLHLWDVHFDFLPPPPYDKKFDPDYTGTQTGENFFFDPNIKADMPARDLEHLLALYDGEIAWTDSWIARIREELERAGVWGNTVFAVTSDHGTEFFEHGRKGHRITLFDEAIRIPLVVRGPARLPHGLRVPAQTRSIDVGPTLLELAGLPVPSDVVGTSLLDLVAHPSVELSRPAVSELFSMQRNLRVVRTREWKFFDDIGRNRFYWFDLARDPGERKPSFENESPQGSRAAGGYRGEVAKLDQFLQAHPVERSAADVPEDVNEQLKRFGYLGNGSDSDEPVRPADPQKK